MTNTFFLYCVSDINECDAGNSCLPTAECLNTIGSYDCKCKEGYRGDGRAQCKG